MKIVKSELVLMKTEKIGAIHSWLKDKHYRKLMRVLHQTEKSQR